MEANFSLSAHLFAYETLDFAHLREAAEAGFRRVELWAMTPHFDAGDAAALSNLKSWLKELSLAPATFHAPFYAGLAEARAGRWLSLAHPGEAARADALARTEASMRAMREAGAGVAVLHPCAPGQAGAGDTWEALQASLERLLALAERLDLTLAVENIPAPLGRPAGLAAFLGRMNHPRLRACLDAGHARLTEGEDAPAAFARLAPLCAATHIHDNDGRRDEHLIPGEGGVDWSAFRGALEAAHYGGALTFEIKRREEPRRATLARLAQAASRLLSPPGGRGPVSAPSPAGWRCPPPPKRPAAWDGPAAAGAELALARLRRMAGERFGAPAAQAVLLAGDASERRYARLHHPGAGPGSSIGMILSAPFDPGELPFLEARAHLAALGQPVPAIYALEPEAGLILLEDGGPRSLEDLWNGSGWEACRPYYETAVDLLIALQEGRRAPSGPALRRAFDPAFFARELHHTRRWAFEALLGMEAPEDRFAPHFDALAEACCRQPFRLTHRDYHSRNLMAGPGGRLMVLDFQDARQGPAAYDLASLVFDSYAGLPGEARELLTGRFREGASAAREMGGPDAFRAALAATALQRNLKAIGTFAFQRAERGKTFYLPSIPPTVRSVRGHLARLPGQAALGKLLGPFLDALERVEARPS
ncbi:MAG: TIM barrel protein [Nitrospinota bacterium]